MKKTACLIRRVTLFSCLMFSVAFLLGMAPISLDYGSGDYLLVPRNVASDRVTHSTQLDAFQRHVIDNLTEYDFARVIFSSNEYYGSEAIVPGSFSVVTPYLFTLNEAHIPFFNSFVFIGWLHVDSDQVVFPGHTVLINGSGDVELYALWDFNESTLNINHEGLSPPLVNSNTEIHDLECIDHEDNLFQQPLLHTDYDLLQPPKVETELLIAEYYVDQVDSPSLADVSIASNLPRVTNAFITGTPRVGSTLTANFTLSSAVSNPTLSFQWQRYQGSNVWVNIVGATGRTFTPTTANANNFIRVRIVGTGFNVAPGGFYSGWVQIASNISTITNISIGGMPRVGNVLTANVTYSPHISNPAINFQWQRYQGSGVWVNIAGATGRTFTPAIANANNFIRVRVQGTGVNVSSAAQFSNWVQVEANVSNITNVNITGAPRVGTALTANVTYSPHISNPTVSFQWQTWDGFAGQWNNIPGATGRTFTVRATDTFVQVRVQGTGVNVSTATHISPFVSILSANVSQNWNFGNENAFRPSTGTLDVTFNPGIVPQVQTNLTFRLTTANISAITNAHRHSGPINNNSDVFLSMDIKNTGDHPSWPGSTRRMDAVAWSTDLPNPWWSIERNIGSSVRDEAEVTTMGTSQLVANRNYFMRVTWQDWRQGTNWCWGTFHVNAELSYWNYSSLPHIGGQFNVSNNRWMGLTNIRLGNNPARP